MTTTQTFRTGHPLDVTLTGLAGISITCRAPLASYIRPELWRGKPVITTYGVGTCNDPNLTDAEWVLRDQAEEANNPFSRARYNALNGATRPQG